MNLAIIGSRNFNNYHQMSRCLSAKSISVIITGNASGADDLAKRYATENEIEVEEYPNDKFEIINRCDAVMAFWDGQSTGTQEMLKMARRLNKPLEVFFVETKTYEPPFAYITL